MIRNSRIASAAAAVRPAIPAKGRAAVARAAMSVESLEDRKLMAVWSYWENYVGFDKIAANYPWLTGGGNSVAVIDKGIDYYHPLLGGKESTGTVSPRIVNVWDYKDNDNTPFPNTSEQDDETSAHATGVAGILAAIGYNGGGGYNQGILQDPTSLLYNIRTNSADSQGSIRSALSWVLANHTKYNIVAINLTDFIGSFTNPSAYADIAAALKAQGVFILTPVANNWLKEPVHYQIGNPAKDPSIFGIGGIAYDGSMRPETQRGPGLDLLGPAEKVTLPYYIPSSNTHILVQNAGTGSSWAAAMTTGTAVLMKQIDPSLTPDEIMQIIKDSGTPTLDTDPPAGTTGKVYYSALNAYAAVGLTYFRRDDVYDQGSGGTDDLAHAAPIALNASGVGQASNLKLLAHDADYYKFTISDVKDYELSVAFNGTSKFPGAQLLDADGNVVVDIPKEGLVRRLTAGTYYIKLASDTTVAGTYSVAVGKQADVNPPPGSPGAGGTFNGLAFSANGVLNWAWYDPAAGQLKFASRTGSTWSAVQVVDSAANTGNFMSMALDATGKPGIAYYDEANTDLKYAHFNGSTWDVQTVDATNTTGYYPSLKYGATGQPAIAYYYKTGKSLRFAQYTGTKWSVGAIDTGAGNDVGRYPSLALNTITGRWGVAYENTTTGNFKVAEQTKSGGWAALVVDATKGGGGFTSMVYDAAGRGAFSYYDAYNADLKYARYTGTKWSTSTIAAKNSQGLYTSLFLDPGNSNLPVIYYFNKTMNTAMVARSNGTTWEFSTVAVNGGRQLAVALDPDDYETFSYVDDATHDLKLAQPA